MGSRPPLERLTPGPPSARPARPGGRRTRRRGAVALGLVPIFSELSNRQLRRLVAATEEVPYPAGAKVVEEGMAGEALFVVLEGEAKVVRGRRTIARLRPGDVFGEISVLDGGPRTATVVSETPLVALRLFRRQLIEVTRKEPAIALKLLAEVARRLRTTERDATH